MQQTQETLNQITLYLTGEEEQTLKQDLVTYRLMTTEEVEELVPFSLRWAFSVPFDDEMQFELRLGLIDDTRAMFIADWYRNGVFYQEELLTQSPIGQQFELILPIDLNTTLTYRVRIEALTETSLSNDAHLTTES